jgi:hypothetical protein
MRDAMTKDIDPRIYTIRDGATVMAHILNLNLDGPIVFPTIESAEMQIGFGTILNDKIIPTHVHNVLRRSTFNTSEFILILKGAMDVVFINSKGHRMEEKTLTEGMGFLQFVGGHRIIFHAGTRYVELKQGPYYGNHKDKTLLKDIYE